MICEFDDLNNVFGRDFVNKLFNVWCDIALAEPYDTLSPVAKEVVYANFKQDTMDIINLQAKEE